MNNFSFIFTIKPLNLHVQDINIWNIIKSSIEYAVKIQDVPTSQVLRCLLWALFSNTVYMLYEYMSRYLIDQEVHKYMFAENYFFANNKFSSSKNVNYKLQKKIQLVTYKHIYFFIYTTFESIIFSCFKICLLHILFLIWFIFDYKYIVLRFICHVCILIRSILICVFVRNKKEKY